MVNFIGKIPFIFLLVNDLEGQNVLGDQSDGAITNWLREVQHAYGDYMHLRQSAGLGGIDFDFSHIANLIASVVANVSLVVENLLNRVFDPLAANPAQPTGKTIFQGAYQVTDYANLLIKLAALIMIFNIVAGIIHMVIMLYRSEDLKSIASRFFSHIVVGLSFTIVLAAANLAVSVVPKIASGIVTATEMKSATENIVKNNAIDWQNVLALNGGAKDLDKAQYAKQLSLWLPVSFDARKGEGGTTTPSYPTSIKWAEGSLRTNSEAFPHGLYGTGLFSTGDPGALTTTGYIVVNTDKGFFKKFKNLGAKKQNIDALFPGVKKDTRSVISDLITLDTSDYDPTNGKVGHVADGTDADDNKGTYGTIKRTYVRVIPIIIGSVCVMLIVLVMLFKFVLVMLNLFATPFSVGVSMLEEPSLAKQLNTVWEQTKPLIVMAASIVFFKATYAPATNAFISWGTNLIEGTAAARFDILQMVICQCMIPIFISYAYINGFNVTQNATGVDGGFNPKEAGGMLASIAAPFIAGRALTRGIKNTTMSVAGAGMHLKGKRLAEEATQAENAGNQEEAQRKRAKAQSLMLKRGKTFRQNATSGLRELGAAAQGKAAKAAVVGTSASVKAAGAVANAGVGVAANFKANRLDNKADDLEAKAKIAEDKEKEQHEAYNNMSQSERDIFDKLHEQQDKNGAVKAPTSEELRKKAYGKRVAAATMRTYEGESYEGAIKRAAAGTVVSVGNTKVGGASKSVVTSVAKAGTRVGKTVANDAKFMGSTVASAGKPQAHQAPKVTSGTARSNFRDEREQQAVLQGANRDDKISKKMEEIKAKEYRAADHEAYNDKYYREHKQSETIAKRPKSGHRSKGGAHNS